MQYYGFYGSCWISAGIIVVLVPAAGGILQRFLKSAHLPSICVVGRTRGRDRAERAPAQPLWGLRESHRLQGDGSQFHKIHRIFHKWMNTISFQFPHYANMQNIKSRPI